MFEDRVLQKTRCMRENTRRGQDPEEEDIEYLLNTVPFIREYTTTTTSVDDEIVATTPTKGRVDAYLNVRDINTGHIYDQYMAMVEKDQDAMVRLASSHSSQEAHVCEACGDPLMYAPVTAQMICTSCGMTTTHYEGGTRGLNYNEQVEYASKRSFTYKRISHFVECLNASQAKQNTSIPDEVVNAMHSEMKKYRLQPQNVTSTHIRGFLKRRGLSKYYEHVNYILSLINHTKQTSLPKHVEETLIKMFIATQQPFETVTDSDRVNFLRYNYIIYKLLEIMGETDYLHMFPLLKSRHKLIQHDQVWKKICAHPSLQWPFIATI